MMAVELAVMMVAMTVEATVVMKADVMVVLMAAKWAGDLAEMRDNMLVSVTVVHLAGYLTDYSGLYWAASTEHCLAVAMVDE